MVSPKYVREKHSSESQAQAVECGRGLPAPLSPPRGTDDLSEGESAISSPDVAKPYLPARNCFRQLNSEMDER